MIPTNQGRNTTKRARRVTESSLLSALFGIAFGNGIGCIIVGNPQGYAPLIALAVALVIHLRGRQRAAVTIHSFKR